MVNPLAPQLRADKNGKLVTRHVKIGIAAPSTAAKMPSPSIAKRFAIPERDVKRPRRAGTTKQSLAEAKSIKEFFGISASQPVNDPIRMSDNEILDYMQEGFTATAAVEFKRWDITPEVARMSGIRPLPVKETVRRMRVLDLSPEEASRIIRNGMTDRLLDKQLDDNELFGLLHEERWDSPKYQNRSKGVQAVILGTNTREDYHELGLETLGKYGGYLNVQRKDGTEVSYEVFRRMIERVESPHVPIPSVRHHEGWTNNDYRMDFHSLMMLVRKYGPEVLDIKYFGVFRMGHRFDHTMEGYQYMDKFFSIAGQTPLRITEAQRDEMKNWKKEYPNVAQLTERMRQEGLTPEQTFHSISNGLTLEKAIEVHFNKQAAAMMDGWL